jgi:predicted ester cyclase
MPPTDRKVSVTGTSIFRIEGGKIAEQWADWNLMSMMEQLGVMSQSKAEAKAPA